VFQAVITGRSTYLTTFCGAPDLTTGIHTAVAKEKQVRIDLIGILADHFVWTSVVISIVTSMSARAAISSKMS